jgi:hypothetical protein
MHIYTVFRMTDPIKETARQRAMRTWRNQQIQRRSIKSDTTEYDKIDDEERRWNVSRSKLVAEIMSIFDKQKHDITVTYYLAVIRARKRKLLIEKLRRLREKTNE